MNASYSVFPESGHVLETFRGSVGYTNLMQLFARQARDRRIGLCQHTVMDFTKATLKLTNEQVRIVADTIGLRSARPRKYAIVIANARNFAIASMFASLLSRDAFTVRCFHSRAAALRWIVLRDNDEYLLGPESSITHRANVDLDSVQNHCANSAFCDIS
jgi:hypothetical protein